MSEINTLFQSDLEVLNVGLELFTISFDETETPYAQVDWKPAAGGNQKLLDALSFLED